jgi:hypothetical protein
MVDIAQGALFILACAFLCGLRVFLFRDQAKSGIDLVFSARRRDRAETWRRLTAFAAGCSRKRPRLGRTRESSKVRDLHRSWRRYCLPRPTATFFDRLLGRYNLLFRE